MSFDRQFWDENGYIVIRNAVPQELVEASAEAIWHYTGKDAENRASWYQEPLLDGAMVNLSHHQVMWDIRQLPIFHDIFSELWGTEKLWIVLDRANMNPPVGNGWDYGGFLHWDMDPTKEPKPMYQGVLYLSDTTEEMGGFQCVPGSRQRMLEWQSNQVATNGLKHEGAEADWMMEKKNPVKEWVLQELEPKPIEAKAGDFVMWDVATLHGNGRNVSTQPRLALYISLTPEWTSRAYELVRGGEELRQLRIDSWQNGAYPGVVSTLLGVPEGIASVWLNDILLEPANVTSVPAPRYTPQLSNEQLAALPQLLQQAQPWTHPDVVRSLPYVEKYGISGYFLPAEFLSREIAHIVADQFGVTFTAEPAQLSQLGERLLGLKSW